MENSTSALDAYGHGKLICHDINNASARCTRTLTNNYQISSNCMSTWRQVRAIIQQLGYLKIKEQGPNQTNQEGSELYMYIYITIQGILN